MDGGAYGVAQSQTWLKQLSSSSGIIVHPPPEMNSAWHKWEEQLSSLMQKPPVASVMKSSWRQVRRSNVIVILISVCSLGLLNSNLMPIAPWLPNRMDTCICHTFFLTFSKMTPPSPSFQLTHDIFNECWEHSVVEGVGGKSGTPAFTTNEHLESFS